MKCPPCSPVVQLAMLQLSRGAHWGSATIDLELHWHPICLPFFFCFLHHYFSYIAFLFVPHLSSLFLSLLHLPSPTLLLTLHCLFSDSKMWVSIFRCSSPLPLISLPLSHLLFFYCWRTDSLKRSKIHQCCIEAAFWSAWWVTTQPRAIIYKCVFINISLSICKSMCCSVVVREAVERW